MMMRTHYRIIKGMWIDLLTDTHFSLSLSSLFHPGGLLSQGMLSLRIQGGRAAAISFAANCRVFQRATSLGGVESLIEHRARYERGGKNRGELSWEIFVFRDEYRPIFLF